MWLGRYKLGDRVMIPVQCVNASREATAPDAAPTCYVWSPGGTRLYTLRLSPVDKFKVTGKFGRRLFLGHLFAAGRYDVVVKYTTGNSAHVGQQWFHFEVLASGHRDGQVIAMHRYDRPDAQYVIQQLASGRVVKGRNPSL